MTTRNFRVNNGLEVGDVAITASSNAVTGVSSITLDNTTAPNADAKLANKKYVDDQISGITALTVGNDNITVADGSVTITVNGNTEGTFTDDGLVINGNLTVQGTTTQIDTTTLRIEDNLIEVNRNISANSQMPSYSGLVVNRGTSSTATEQDLFWVWDEGFADDGTTTHGNAGGAWTALRAARGTDTDNPSEITSTETVLVDMRCNVLHATSTSALYADLGERFEADAPMGEGAVVELGGDAEITESTSELSEQVFGVISKQPAYAMNAGAGNEDSHPFVAMTGRTPVRVIGEVSKGQRLVSSTTKGCARAVADGESINPFHVIGRALEAKTDEGIGLVNSVVRTNN